MSVNPKGRLVVFDLDGTLALNDHRHHYVNRPVGEKDWRAFFDACDKDKLNPQAFAALMALYVAGCDVVIWTGRTDRVREKTEAWLQSHSLGQIPLKMREEHDHRPDTEVKKEWLDQASQKPWLAFDDRNSVVEMWRENDVPCFQVARGDF